MFSSVVNDMLLSQWNSSKFSTVGPAFPDVEMAVVFVEAPVGNLIGLLSLLNV